MRKWLSTFGIAALLNSPSLSAQDAAQSEPQDDAAVFEKFKQLAGTFQEIDVDGAPAIIEYRLISRGNALQETWIMPAGTYGPNGKRELTVFHMDNGVLVATHYCASGIHPTMALDPESPAGTYNFVPRAISNLASTDQSHNSGFGYAFEDEDTVYRSEQWTVDGEDRLSFLRMVRASD